MAQSIEEIVKILMDTSRSIGKAYTDLMSAFMKAVIAGLQRALEEQRLKAAHPESKGKAEATAAQAETKRRAPFIDPQLIPKEGDLKDLPKVEEWPPKPKFK